MGLIGVSDTGISIIEAHKERIGANNLYEALEDLLKEYESNLER